MNNQSYEEYIRNIIGYPTNNTYSSNLYENNYIPNNINCNNDVSIIEECYPKIYRMINPMVQKACNQNAAPITKELIENMTKEIYLSIESETEVNLNINLSNNVRNDSKSSVSNKNSTNETRNTQENRALNPRNPLLNDLIKILIIKELLGRPNNNRPPFPGGRPPRPPFPGNRPPIMPRDFNNDFDIYQY